MGYSTTSSAQPIQSADSEEQRRLARGEAPERECVMTRPNLLTLCGQSKRLSQRLDPQRLMRPTFDVEADPAANNPTGVTQSFEVMSMGTLLYHVSDDVFDHTILLRAMRRDEFPPYSSHPVRTSSISHRSLPPSSFTS